MKTKTSKWQVPLLNIIIPAATLPAILGVQQWREDTAHGFIFLLARFFVVWAVAAACGIAVGFVVLRFFVKK